LALFNDDQRLDFNLACVEDAPDEALAFALGTCTIPALSGGGAGAAVDARTK